VPGMKLRPPVISSFQVSQVTQVIRQGVSSMLRAASSARLVLARAPAGFGKTTAMLQHQSRLEESSVATGWFTLDHADNDPARFLCGLEAVLVTIVRDDALADFSEPAPATPGEVAWRAMNLLAALKTPFALFLDDFEVLHEPSVLAWVREIVDHLPPHGQLVIGSRSMPDLRLGRLRARGQLLEIDALALRFSIEETEQFLRAALPRPLATEDLLRLHQKTEGWPAALWLASASLRNSEAHTEFINRFSGTNRSVADYLAEDVIAWQSEPVRRFLLRTSLLHYVSAPLCQALLPNADCEAILGELENSSLIVPIENESGTWRYPGLMAEFLKAQLQREAPQEVSELHRAAAAWYFSQNRPVPAIGHALEGGDFAHVVDLLATHAPALLAQGRMRLLSRWFDALPGEFLRDHRPLQVTRVWALTFTRGPSAAMELLSSSGLLDTQDPAVRPHVLALRPTLLAMMDRFEEALEVGRECLTHWPTGSAFADMVLANAMSDLLAATGQRIESRRLLEAARRTQGTDSSAFNLMYSETVEAMIDLQEGRLREASARLHIATGNGSSHHYGYTGGNAWAGLMYAATIYEANDLEQAARLLRVYVPLARDTQLADHVTLGYVMLARIAFARGDVDEAFEHLIQLEYLGHVRRLARMAAAARLERARILLMQGHSRASKEEMTRIENPALWERVGRQYLIGNDLDYLQLAQLRWEALAGDARGAAPQLRKAAEIAGQEARHRRAMKLRLLAALAYQRAGEPITAQSMLEPVLKAASTEGYARLLLDEGSNHVGPLLRQASRMLDASGAVSRDPVLAEWVLRLVRACGPAEESSLPPDKRPPLLDPLTQKEIRVLQLLAEGYSNSAIAEKLFVSDSTVRTHLRNINHKVCARSRTQAVAIARRLGVIS
jgi:LuxR family transcriptional regulator, maltose regulon positive regulatory protein